MLDLKQIIGKALRRRGVRCNTKYFIRISDCFGTLLKVTGLDLLCRMGYWYLHTICLSMGILYVLLCLFSASKTGTFLVSASDNKESYMLQVKNVCLTHKKDLRSFVENFSFTLNPGDKAVIIGEEGNGKSTLLKWIYSPELIENYVEARGERLLGKEILGYLPQELPSCYSERTVYDYFSESVHFFDLSYLYIFFNTDKFIFWQLHFGVPSPMLYTEFCCFSFLLFS